jgi:hypothetical protein
MDFTAAEVIFQTAQMVFQSAQVNFQRLLRAFSSRTASLRLIPEKAGTCQANSNRPQTLLLKSSVTIGDSPKTPRIVSLFPQNIVKSKAISMFYQKIDLEIF